MCMSRSSLFRKSLIFHLAFFLYVCCAASVASGSVRHDYVFIIDTSSSMKSNKLVGPLRVAVDDYADTIPIDGSSRIWIFTFDRGVSSSFFQRAIVQSKDLEDAKVFLTTREAKGSRTYIYEALDKVFEKIEGTIKEGTERDVVIHLFTDGEDGSPRRYSFEKNVERFRSLRVSFGGKVELYYHALGVVIKRDVQRLIDQTEGIFAINSVQIPPKAQFNIAVPNIIDNAPITFINQTTGKADTWQWDFGGGATSSEKNATYVFKEPGQYTVRLTAEGGSGEARTSSSISKQIHVKGGPPIARFRVEDGGKALFAGSIVSFVDESVGSIKSWSWDFGDGKGKSSEKNPEYSYTEPGTYKVVLRLTGV